MICNSCGTDNITPEKGTIIKCVKCNKELGHCSICDRELQDIPLFYSPEHKVYCIDCEMERMLAGCKAQIQIINKATDELTFLQKQTQQLLWLKNTAKWRVKDERAQVSEA